MGRLPGFDYKRPFFYMVTLKRAQAADAARCKTSGQQQCQVLPGGASTPPIHPFSAISKDGKVVVNAVTEAFEAEIREWSHFWRSVESVWPYVIMPDHLHLLIKLAAVE